MSGKVFGGLVAGTVLVGLCIGWFLGAPAAPRQRAVASIEAANLPSATGEDTAPPTGEDTQNGWRERKRLRDNLASALTAVEAAPCDKEAREGFLGAFVARARVMADDSNASSDEAGPAFWRTSMDDKLTLRIEKLKNDGYISQDEINHAVMSRLGGGLFGAPQLPEPPAPPRCPTAQS